MLSKIDSFGDVAAEDDPVLDYFLTTKAVETIASGKVLLVLGRKGTGKTAIVRYFTERRADALSKSLNLRGYPWNVHESRIDHGASEIEAYVSSWRYLIAVELCALLLSQEHIKPHPKLKALSEFLTDNYGGTEPQLSDILRPAKLRLSKFSFLPSVMGNQLGGIDLERKQRDHHFGLELNSLSSSIINAILEVAGDASLGPLSLHFDELDQGLSRIDEARTKMIIGLILASREIRRETRAVGEMINPIVYLRTDIWEDLQFSDKNKISQTMAHNLVWDPASLRQLIDTRVRARLSPTASWDDVAEPDLMRGSQTKWNHILARTFLRPRDVIRFLNAALKEAKLRNSDVERLGNKDIVKSRDEYFSYLKEELDDEIEPHWPRWDEALQACSAISTITFERDEFTTEYENRRSSNSQISSSEALSLLYRFSVIGYERRSGYGGSSWAFQYTDPEAGWDNLSTRFKVHLGLKEYARLREARTGIW